ncbi:MAG: non-ribosomal peptide synthetase [bacterium]|nr:non-ribosomal peptide synthetase [bacterium]
MIDHHSLVNRLNWMQKRYPLDEGDTILHKTPFTFDVSVWEIFWWSMTGALVCLPAPGVERDPRRIVEAVHRHGVTVMHFVPSMLRVFLEYVEESGSQGRLSSLKQVIASGEALTVPMVKQFNRLLRKENLTALANLYGPTEATIDVSFFDCPGGEDIERIPIGKPIDNTQLYILDKYLNVQPVGVAGELFISGTGVARGYLNRPELTGEKFNKSYKSYRTYKTGDLCRWLPDGNIEYLGRIDHQVKVRGFRIELEEIEKHLLSHESIKETVVIADIAENEENVLHAYIVSKEEINVQGLREHLSRKLPDYMVPSVFKRLDRIPLTSNGKVDRRALRASGTRLGGGDKARYAAPGTPAEQKIAAIWKETLKLQENRLGIHDNFFDIGGTSMDVIRVNGKVAREFETEIPVVAMYKYTTIRSLAQFIEQGETGIETRRTEKIERGRNDKTKIREMRRRGRR